jgi:hypothetical protein
MTRLRLGLALLTTLMPAAIARAQTSAPPQLVPDLAGTWRAETVEGPQTVIVRSDSSASFGDEIVRWRATADTVYLALGGEWVGYHFVLRGRTLVLSGGDLEDPVRLEHVGPPTPRPAGIPVPPPPSERAGR